MNSGRKPDIVCIGAQKAGTSWLYEMLASRTDVWTPPFKELHFFDHKFIEECRKWAPWHVRKGIKRAKQRHLADAKEPDASYLEYLEQLIDPPILNGTWYKHVFSRAPVEQVCVDVTPEYSCLPEEGVAFFKRFLPDTKIIYIIRDPMERILSQARMNLSRLKKQPETEEEWDQFLENPAFRTRGDYKTYIPRWRRAYNRDQLWIVPYGLIGSDAVGFMRAVEQHCGLPKQSYANASRRIHVTEQVTIPDEIKVRFADLVAGQSDFLSDQFGDEFLQAVR